uniref:40S ribosomal protein S25 n=1 Tax=Steinernema glaseri TaxID=37863 RepID=A0A1I7Y6U1_9BILA
MPAIMMSFALPTVANGTALLAPTACEAIVLNYKSAYIGFPAFLLIVLDITALIVILCCVRPRQQWKLVVADHLAHPFEENDPCFEISTIARRRRNPYRRFPHRFL